VAPPGSINIGRPWSEIELADLVRGLRIGVSLEVISDFIERDLDEVRQKAGELGILRARKLLPDDRSPVGHGPQSTASSASWPRGPTAAISGRES
jgi:hypothetical protein